MAPSTHAIENVTPANAVQAGTVTQLSDGRFGVELLNNPHGDIVFGAVAREMVGHGWSVFPQDPHTRRPASLYGRTLCPKSDYHVDERPADAETLLTWCQHAAKASVACMFGPAMPGLFAIDADILDEEMSDRVMAIAEDELGSTPYVRVGRAPKFAAFYRVSGELLASRSIRLANESGEDSGNAIEILSVGKTITLHGRHHKTGEYYKWISGSTPVLDLPTHAPEVSAAQVEAFLNRVAQEFPAVKQSSYSEGQWVEGDAGKVRVAKVSRPEGAPVATDGREELLRDLVWRTCRLNGRSFILANPGAELEGVLADVAAAVVGAFKDVAACTGRWAPGALRTAASSRVRALCDRIRSGDVQPSKSKTVDIAPARELPVIVIEVGEIEPAVDQAEAALTFSGRGVYQRSGAIVQLGNMPIITSSGREISAQRIYEVGERALLEHISMAARFERWDDKLEGNKHIAAPMWVAQTLAARLGRLRLPVLAGVVSAPTLRPDGSLLFDEGYDAATGLLLDFEGAQYPAISERPTRSQAEAAMGTLKHIIRDFPFVNEAHRSVAIAAMLTASVRRSIRTAPLFAFSATAPGSGKSKLVDIAAVIATGREAGVVAQGKSSEEDEKRIGSLLLTGAPVIAIDNCELPVGGDLLCQLLTQTTVRTRILGRSESPEVPTSALVCATGNNLILYGDMTRRSLLAHLDPGVDRPELRTFNEDPVAEASRRRPELVAAALTVILAFKASSEPGKAPLGSFEAWSRTVRDAMVWLGCADPVDTIEEARALDPKLDAMSSVMTQWRAAFGPGRVTVRDIIEAATEQRSIPDSFKSAFVRPDFREALLAVAEVAGNVNSRRLGKWLSAHAGRIIDGCKIVREGTAHGGVQLWSMHLSEQAQAEWAEVVHAAQGSNELQRAAEAAFGSSA